MMRRYLDTDERARFDAIDARRRRRWLLGRIAVKDAVRRHLWARGEGHVWPVEIGVANEPSGRPVLVGPRAGALRVSVARKDELAVAIVGDGVDVGIDVEKIAPRTPAFVDTAFVASELALGDGRDRDEWLTRLWCAKEAVAKARGTGISDPKRLVVRGIAAERTPLASDPTLVRLELDDAVVDTARDGDYIVAWTVAGSRA
jgi:phosphopantetheinyl transferase